MTFDEWLAVGIENKFCSQIVCATHDYLPMNDAELQAIDDGFCVDAIRVYAPTPIHLGMLSD
jgi:hypothetical protein